MNHHALSPQIYSFLTPLSIVNAATILGALFGLVVWALAWSFVPPGFIETHDRLLRLFLTSAWGSPLVGDE